MQNYKLRIRNLEKSFARDYDHYEHLNVVEKLKIENLAHNKQMHIDDLAARRAHALKIVRENQEMVQRLV